MTQCPNQSGLVWGHKALIKPSLLQQWQGVKEPVVLKCQWQTKKKIMGSLNTMSTCTGVPHFKQRQYPRKAVSKWSSVDWILCQVPPCVLLKVRHTCTALQGELVHRVPLFTWWTTTDEGHTVWSEDVYTLLSSTGSLSPCRVSTGHLQTDGDLGSTIGVASVKPHTDTKNF